jgi:hypothetical protein
MTKEQVFKTDEPLWPGDPAFTDDVYWTSVMKGRALPLDFSAKVISSPRKAGKTTQLNLIGAKHLRASRFEEGSKTFIRIDRRDGGIPENELKDMLIQELGAQGASTFEEVILTSKKIRNYKGRKVLAMMQVENLSEPALRWLLAGIKRLENTTTKRLNLQVLIDGSFAVDTMTWGETSEFPLDHMYPPEFSQETQKKFVSSRVSQLKLLFTNAAYHELWKATRGDKYLTQAICKRIVEHPQLGAPAKTVDDDDVCETIEAYTQEDPSRDTLKPDLLRAFFVLSEQSPEKEQTPQKEFYVKELLNCIQDVWHSLTVQERDQAYRGGLIRRSRRGIELRAPLIRGIFEKTARRVWEVRTLFASHLSLSGLAEPYRTQAEGIVRQVIEHAYTDSLSFLHVGLGRKVGEKRVEVQANALYQGDYSGYWDIEAKNAREGEEVWGVMWAWDGPDGRDSRIRVLPVRKP